MSDADAEIDDTTEGTFLVTHADDDSAMLRDVDRGQVHTLSSNPGLEVTAELVEVEERWSLSIRESREPPTTHEREIAAEQSVGELTREERAGIGELHVISVPEEETEAAVEDVLEDREATLGRAARLGVNRVEIRSEPGVVSVRYLP